MYRRVYRQEGGGLSNLGSEAFMRQYVDNYVQNYKERNKGEVAAKVMPRPVPIIPQRPRATIPQIVKKGISNLIPLIQNNPIAKLAQKSMNLPELNKLESEPQYGPGYTGKPSDARHQAGANEISKNVSNLIDKGSLGLVPEKVRDFLGDIVPNLGGGIKELGSLIYNTAPNRFGVPSPMPPKEALDMAIEDVKANYKGSFGTDNTKTAREIYEDVYGINNPKDDYGGVQEAIQNQLQKPEQSTNNPYIGASHNSPMWFGGYPLQSGDTLTTEQMKTERQGGSTDYRIPPNLKLQYNEDGTGTIISKPNDEMDTTAGYTTDNWFKALDYYNPNNKEQRVNAFQPVATPVSMQNQQQGLPSLMKIVNEQQNPTPVVPSNATGFNNKADAMADHNEKYRGGLVNVYQNADGSWSYQPPYNLDSPPPRALGLPITPGGPAL